MYLTYMRSLAVVCTLFMISSENNLPLSTLYIGCSCHHSARQRRLLTVSVTPPPFHVALLVGLGKRAVSLDRERHLANARNVSYGGGDGVLELQESNVVVPRDCNDRRVLQPSCVNSYSTCHDS